MRQAIESGLKTVFSEAKAYKGKTLEASGHETGIYQTCFHILGGCRIVNPDITLDDIAPFLESFCKKKKLDYDECLIQMDMLIEFRDEEGKPLDITRPLMDAQLRIKVDPYRVELPEGFPEALAKRQPILDLATALKYVADNSEPEGTFFISCRDAGDLIGKSHEAARGYLQAFIRYGVISEEAKGKFNSRAINQASRYIYLLGNENEASEKGKLTQEIQESKEIHHHQKLEVSQDIPAPLESIEEVKPTVPMQEHGGGGEATLFEEQPRKRQPLGTADELIEMSVTEKPGGVLGVLPRQADIPMPEPVKVRTPERKADSIEVHQTATAPGTERTKPQYQWERLSETAKRNSPVCDHCGKRAFEHTSEEAEAHYQLTRKQTAPKSNTPVDTLRRDSAKLNNACKAEGVTGYERTKRFAGLFAKHFGDSKASTVKYAADLIDQYSLKEFGATASSVLTENATRRTPFDNPIGIVGYRLRTNAGAVAV